MSGNLSFEVAYTVLPGDEPDPADWTDLTAKLVEPVETGDTATIVLEDLDRGLDPTVDGDGDLVRHARLTGHANSTDIALWRGLTDQWSPRWQAGKSVVAVTLVDALAWCGLQDENVDRPQESTTDRVTALLDLADWPASLRDIGSSQVMLEPHAREGGNLRREIEDAVDAEGGRLWVAADGKITFRGRHATHLDLAQQATIGTGGLPLVDGIDPDHDTARLTNRVRVELADGTVHTKQDATSVASRGPRTDAVRDLALPWYESVGVADWDVHRFKDKHTWIYGVTVNVIDEDDLETALGLDVTDRVQFVATVRGKTFDEPMVIDSRPQHRIIAGGWTMTLDLAPYFGAGPWLTLDDATLGTLDDGNKVGP